LEGFILGIRWTIQTLGAAHQSGSHKAKQDLDIIGDKMLKLVAGGKVSSMLKEIISLEEVPNALSRLQNGM
jgi:NADPH:quinone reductase